jgi:hypothetical protein
LTQLKERVRLEFTDDIGYERDHQGLQVPVADVARGNEQQLGRATLEEVPVHEVGILADYHLLLLVGQGINSTALRWTG